MNADESDDSSNDFEIAANPLNSLNPPPKDLPDLLDGLLVSDSGLHNKLQCCANLSEEIGNRVADLQRRLENLRSKFPQWRSDEPQQVEGPRDKHRLAFGVQEAIYVRMLSQISFLYHVAHRQLPHVITEQRKQVKHIFDAFLGDLHDHHGIEIANSAHLHCVEGCRWYFESGPYEWTKKPYSHEWWAEMNHTNWDWVKMRKHIEDLMKNTASKQIRAVNDFETHIRRFVPPWFWRGETHRWGLQSRFRIIEKEGVKKVHMNVFVSYQKTEQEMEQEHAKRLAVLVQQQREQEGVENETSIDTYSIVIEPMGAVNVNNNTIFDDELFVADWEQAASTPKGSWLKYWGYDTWLSKQSNADATT